MNFTPDLGHTALGQDIYGLCGWVIVPGVGLPLGFGDESVDSEILMVVVVAFPES